MSPSTHTPQRVLEPVGSPVGKEAKADSIASAAYENFWYFRQLMNPRLKLKGYWFPGALAQQLRKFWDDFKAGKRPILLLCCPPQF